MSKEKIIDAIIAREGGYVHDPRDSGGRTRWGITEAVAREWGYTGEMRDLPRDEAFRIYSKLYWEVNQLDQVSRLSEAIAEEVADTGVNCGPTTAAKFLQRSLNVLNRGGSLYRDLEVDGSIAAATIKALSDYLSARRDGEGEVVLLRALNCLQGAYYINLAERREKDEAFLFGWLKERVK